jgi:hypothetical protein
VVRPVQAGSAVGPPVDAPQSRRFAGLGGVKHHTLNLLPNLIPVSDVIATGESWSLLLHLQFRRPFDQIVADPLGIFDGLHQDLLALFLRQGFEP